MRSSIEETISLLKKWKEDGVWMYVLATLGRDETHKFWSKVSGFLESSVMLEGKAATLEIPLESSTFEYLEPHEAPEHIRGSFDRFEFCLVICSHNVLVYLVGARPNAE